MRAYLVAGRSGRAKGRRERNTLINPTQATAEVTAPPRDWRRLSDEELEVFGVLLHKLDGVDDPGVAEQRRLVFDPPQWVPLSPDSDQRYYTRTMRLESIPTASAPGPDRTGAKGKTNASG